MQIATWNVNSLRVRLPHLQQWMDLSPVDIVALQETKLPDESFPMDELQQRGWHVLRSGQKTYNGVALLSRTPARDVVYDMGTGQDPQRRFLAATVPCEGPGEVRVVNIYAPNGQTVGSDKYRYKLDWFAALAAWLKEELTRHPLLVLLGDFNVAPEDRDVHDPSAWEGSVLVSPPERAALRDLLLLGMTDVFRRFDQPAAQFSWWDYRAAAFRRNLGLRIDLILASPALAVQCRACRIEREPRSWERPSDHAPVVATF